MGEVAAGAPGEKYQRMENAQRQVLAILLPTEAERDAAQSLFARSECCIPNGELDQFAGRNCLAIGPADWEASLRGQIGALASAYRGADPLDALPGGTLAGAVAAGWTAAQVGAWSKKLTAFQPPPNLVYNETSAPQRGSEAVTPRACCRPADQARSLPMSRGRPPSQHSRRRPSPTARRC